MGGTGPGPFPPWLFVGHSMGAASMAITARYYLPSLGMGLPPRPGAALLVGSPKPGDTRLIAALRRKNVVVLSNVDDIITTVPPDEATGAALESLFPTLAW